DARGGRALVESGDALSAGRIASRLTRCWATPVVHGLVLVATDHVDPCHQRVVLQVEVDSCHNLGMCPTPSLLAPRRIRWTNGEVSLPRRGTENRSCSAASRPSCSRRLPTSSAPSWQTRSKSVAARRRTFGCT